MELVHKVDGKELFANRATNDSQGRKIDTTYATSSELATKQNTIYDLDTIRSGASAGATALQQSDLTLDSEDRVTKILGHSIMNDETVLFEGEFTGSTLSLTEQVTNFEYIRIYYVDSDGYAGSQEILGTSSTFSLTSMFHHNNNNFYIKSSGSFSISGSTFTRLTQGLQIRLNSTKLAIDGWTKNDTNVKLTKVVGIGRKTSDPSEGGESWDPS